MIISDSRKFIFVHIPKTAGKSIGAALQPYANRRAEHPLHIHEGLDEFFQRIRKEGNRPLLGRFKRPNRDASLAFADYFSFAFVRNPWERAVSAYSYIKHIRLAGAETAVTFDEFVRHLDEGRHYLRTVHVTRPQLDFITDYRGHVVVDMVGRFETLEENFRAICGRIGIEAPLAQLNRSQHHRYQGYYDDRARAIVGRIYAADAAAFGYDFDGVAHCNVAAASG